MSYNYPDAVSATRGDQGSAVFENFADVLEHIQCGPSRRILPHGSTWPMTSHAALACVDDDPDMSALLTTFFGNTRTSFPHGNEQHRDVCHAGRISPSPGDSRRHAPVRNGFIVFRALRARLPSPDTGHHVDPQSRITRSRGGPGNRGRRYVPNRSSARAVARFKAVSAPARREAVGACPKRKPGLFFLCLSPAWAPGRSARRELRFHGWLAVLCRAASFVYCSPSRTRSTSLTLDHLK